MTELELKVNNTLQLRKHGFPFLMPIIKALQLQGANKQMIMDQMNVLVKNHVTAKYEILVQETGIPATKDEFKRAFLSLIERDFIKKGLTRERIALEALKKTNKSILWDGDVPWEVESQGIDITGNGYSIGISVKGWKYGGNDKEHHIEKLKANQFKKNYIFYVNEKTKRIKTEEVIRDGK